MGSVLIVELHPGRQGSAAMFRASVRHGIRPFPLQRLNEPLGFAVGLRAIGSGTLGGDAEPSTGFAEGSRAIGSSIVGEHPLDVDAAAREFPHGAQPKARGGVAFLIRQDFDVAKARAIVDRDMGIFPPSSHAAGALTRNAMAGLGKAAQSFDVDMDQLTGTLPLVALHRFRWGEVAHAIQPNAREYCADGGARDPASI